MKEFTNRVAVVTGGANGIGFAMAKRFMAEGMRVVIADIDQDHLDRAVQTLSEFGKVAGKRTDVADAASVQELADFAVSTFGAVHILCNNAGVGGLQRFSSTDLSSWRWILGVNLWGVINGCKLFLPILQAQDEAHIVNTASMAAFSYGAYHHPYHVSKAGVVALSEGLQAEFAQDIPNVSVSILAPGFTATAIQDDERNAPADYTKRSEADPTLDGLRRSLNKRLDGGKSPEEVADLVLEGIREKRTHIFTDGDWLGPVSRRSDQIVAELRRLKGDTE